MNNYLQELAKQLISFGLKLMLVLAAIILVVAIINQVINTNIRENNYAYAHELSVEGTAKIKVSPDSAEISLAKNIRGTNVSTIQTQASTAINKLTSNLNNIGIKNEQIKTTNYSLTPNYDLQNNVTGYAINVEVTITMEKTNPQDKLISQVIAAGTDSGIDEVRNLRFYLADQDNITKQLEASAIDDAKKVALKRAQDSGIKLGAVDNIMVGNNYPLPQYNYNQTSSSKAVGAPSAPINPVQTPATVFNAGQFDLKINVTLTYQIL